MHSHPVSVGKVMTVSSGASNGVCVSKTEDIRQDDDDADSM